MRPALLVLTTLALGAPAWAASDEPSPAARERMSPTAASPETKEAPPRPGTPRDVPIPAARTVTLANGLRLTLVPYGSVPKATVSLVVDAGNVYEGPDQVWLADLTARMLEQGTTSRSAADLAEAAARMGGEIGIRIAADRATLGGEVLGDFADDLLRLVADMARNPRWPESELPRLKADLRRHLDVELAQSQPLAEAKFRAVLYGDHRYGRLHPTPAQLDAFTLDHVRAFHRAHWSAARAHVFVAGVFDAPAVEQAAREAFSGWERGSPAAPPRPAPRAARGLHVIDRPGAVQSTLIVGLPVIDPSHADWVPLSVTHTLLAGYFSSRITANIRENKGYSYSPQGQLSSRRRDAYWAEEADVATAVTGPALKEILGEIERLRAAPPSEEELATVKAYMSGIFLLRNSNRGAIITQLDFVDLNGLAADFLASYVSRVQAVTPQVVQEMTRKYLDPAKLTLVVVGDRKTIDAQLEPFR
jgi:predicted Zn-dependent peptidase